MKPYSALSALNAFQFFQFYMSTPLILMFKGKITQLNCATWNNNPKIYLNWLYDLSFVFFHLLLNSIKSSFKFLNPIPADGVNMTARFALFYT